MVERILFGPGGATEAKQDIEIASLSEIATALKSEKKILLDYTGGPTAADPVYIASGPYAASESASVWKVQKLTYTGSNVTKIETRPNASWTARATPTPAWD